MKLIIIVKDDCDEHELVTPFGPFIEQDIQKGSNMAQKITITDTQKFKIGPVTGVDAKGNQATLGGPLTFTAGSPDNLKVDADPDSPADSAWVSAVGPLGTSQVVVTDTVETAVIDVEVIGSAEAALALPVGSPIEQSPAASPTG